MVSFSYAFGFCVALWLFNQPTLCLGQDYCLGFKTLTAGDGEIVSHRRVGNGSYLNNMSCYWQISAPSGHRVAAWFSYIDLEESDRVTLYDGVTGSAVIEAVSRYYSSSYVSPRYVSTSNIMTVYFYTNSNYTRNGFRLQYSVANDSSTTTSVPEPLSTDTQTFTAITSLVTNSTFSGNSKEQDDPKETPVFIIAFSVAGPALFIGLSALVAVLLRKRLRAPPSDQNCQGKTTDAARRAAAHDYVYADFGATRQSNVEDDEEETYDTVDEINEEDTYDSVNETNEKDIHGYDTEINLQVLAN